MDRPVLIVEAPIMDDENVTKLHDFIHELLRSFEGHYYPQLNQQARSKELFEEPLDDFVQGQDPF